MIEFREIHRAKSNILCVKWSAILCSLRNISSLTTWKCDCDGGGSFTNSSGERMTHRANVSRHRDSFLFEDISWNTKGRARKSAFSVDLF